MIWLLSIIGALAALAGALVLAFAGSIAGAVLGLLLWIFAALLAIYWELRALRRGPP